MNNKDQNIGCIIIFNESKGKKRALIGIIIDIEHEFCEVQNKNIIVFKTYEYVETYQINEETQNFWEFSSWKHVYNCNFGDDGMIKCNCPGFKFL